MNATMELKTTYAIVEEEADDQMEETWDDVSGARLDPIATRWARKDEIEYIHKNECMYASANNPMAQEDKEKTNHRPLG